jgi:lipopolysaccharide export system permease protein
MTGRNLSKTIFRYIVRDAFFAFLVCFLFFFFVFFVNQLLLMAGEILSKRVPFRQVALLVFFSLPSVIALAAPFASLTATLMTIGRLATDNEVLVMLSSGISYANIVLPALFTGLVISLLSFFANDILLPAGTVQFARLYRRILISSPGLELEANSVKRFSNTLVITGNISGKNMEQVIVMDRTNDGERRTIVSKGASLRESPGAKISIDLSGAFVHSGKENERGNYDYAASSRLSYTVSQEDMVEAFYTPGPREMSSVDVRTEIRRKQAALAETLDTEKRRLLENALALESTLRAGKSGGDWPRLATYFDELSNGRRSTQVMANDRSIAIFRLEYYKKFSIPFGALSFVFLAVTLGLLSKKAGQTVGFIIGIIISVLYWAMLLSGQTLGTQFGFSPFWSMWLPNAIALVSGLVLLAARVRR